RDCRVLSMRLVAIAGLRIGTVTDQKRRSGPAPSIAADSYTSLGTELSAAEYTSIEQAEPLQMLTKATAMIGALNSRSWGGRQIAPRIVFRLPSSEKKVYSRYPATTSGRIQQPITIEVTRKVITRLARSISSARIMPRMFWPITAETTVNTMVSATEFQK